MGRVVRPRKKMLALPARLESDHYKDTQTYSQFIEVVILKKVQKTILKPKSWGELSDRAIKC